MQNKNYKKKPDPFIKVLTIIFVLSLYTLGSLTLYRFLQGFNPVSMIKDAAFSQKRNQLEKLIDNNYYKDPPTQDYESNMFKGLVNSLQDPYSAYYTPEEYSAYTENITGKYVGIGAVLTKIESGEAMVKEIFPDSPAEEAGLMEGDLLISADGNLSTSMELDTFVSHIRGEEGTTVSIIYTRDGVENKVEIKRRKVSTVSVYYNMADENTAYLQITEFQENTAKEFMNAIRDLETQGMENIIYDLRGNPGGYVSVVTEILDEMLPAGITVYMEDKHGNRTNHESDDVKQLKYPCIVLVDHSSASSSEIFAGAVRDFHYGQLLGTVTTGKGVVQTVFNLPDKSAVKLTIAQYFTPSGTSIHEVGIVPDIELEYEYLGPEDGEYEQRYDNQLQKALELLD